MIPDSQFHHTYESAIRRLTDGLVRHRRKLPWAREGLERLAMFESLFGEGDEPLMDSILHLSPLFDLPSSSGRTAAEKIVGYVGAMTFDL